MEMFKLEEMKEEIKELKKDIEKLDEDTKKLNKDIEKLDGDTEELKKELKDLSQREQSPVQQNKKLRKLFCI